MSSADLSSDKSNEALSDRLRPASENCYLSETEEAQVDRELVRLLAREQAAVQRAELLARANAAMAKTVGRLVERPDIRNFVGEVLSVFAEEFDAVGVEYWAYIDDTVQFVPSLSYDRSSGNLEDEGNEWRGLDRLRADRKTEGGAPSLAGRITRSTTEDFDSRPEFAPFREKLREQGIRVILGVPMFIRDECFGVICLRLTENRALSASEEELAFALAQQLALALQLTRLAEEAKESAVAREQEASARARAAELVKANEILRSTVDVMTSIPALDEFLGTVMVAINESLGANGSTLWLFDYATETASLAMTAIDGVWSQRPPAFGEGILATQFPSGDELQNQRLRNQPTFNPSIQQHPHVDPGTKAWLSHLNVIALQELPIRVGKRVIGSLSIHCEANEPFSSEKLELAIVLTQQLGLAIHITRLAEEAQQAAVAREQEKAARNQTAQLVRANRSISSSLKDLTAYTDLGGFLGKMLLTIAQQLDEDSGGVWLYDKTADRLTFRLCLEDGVLSDRTWTHTEWLVFQDEPDVFSSNEPRPSHGLRNRVRVHSWQEIETRPEWEVYREILREQKVRCTMEIPMFVGKELIGFYSLRAKKRETFSDAEIEIAVALANQAALAMHVGRLADEAKQAAVAREQDRATLAERARISEEIHDGIQQVFTAIMLQLGTAQRQFAENEGNRSLSQTAIQRAASLAETGLEEVQRSVAYLRETLGDNPGDLHRMLDVLCRSMDSDRIKCRFSASGPSPMLSAKAARELHRLCQEALSNACKHSGADEVRVHAESSVGSYCLTISDDGAGFDVNDAGFKHGMGLKSMKERAERVGARLRIDSQRNGGTVVRVSLPVA